jgi:hypothetical protein
VGSEMCIRDRKRIYSKLGVASKKEAIAILIGDDNDTR